MNSIWTRRAWLTAAAVQGSALAVWPRGRRPHTGRPLRRSPRLADPSVGRVAPESLEQWAQRAVEAAHAAGASYADARLTRTVAHSFSLNVGMLQDSEIAGMGVRVLVQGYWGFAACPLWLSAPTGPDTVAWLAKEAVAQATVSARGTPRTVELEGIPVAAGTWVTPMRIDPFTISPEEKIDTMNSWGDLCNRAGVTLDHLEMFFLRQERVLATSEGTHIRQTGYQTGALSTVTGVGDAALNFQGIDAAGKGWELFDDAKIPEQIAAMPERLMAENSRIRALRPTNPLPIGQYTLVCDSATMAELLAKTLGVATQLDRALGYEANAGGTSYLDDPLGLLGHFPVASPLVTVTANRSAPEQLATVQWDDEGVVPEDVTLVKDGVLMDFQTTRESAAWLAPYYARQGKPVRSHGYAAAEDATYLPLNHLPNLALTPGREAVGVEEMAASVKDGLLLEDCMVEQMDFQARTGLIVAPPSRPMRLIKDGKLGRVISGGGAVFFSSTDLWKQVTALGGAATVKTHSQTGLGALPYLLRLQVNMDEATASNPHLIKGQPAQLALMGYSVSAGAATIERQPLIDAGRRA